MASKRDLQCLAQLLHDGIGSSDNPLVIDQLENMLQSVEYVLSKTFPESTNGGGEGGEGGATKSSTDAPQKAVRFSDVVEVITDDNLGTGIGVMLPRVIEVCVYTRLDLMNLRGDLETYEPTTWKRDFSKLTSTGSKVGDKKVGDKRMSQNQVGRLKAIFHVLSSCRHPLSVPWNIDEKVAEALSYEGDGSRYFTDLDKEFHKLIREPLRVVPTVKLTTVIKTMRFLLHTLRLHRSYIKEGETVRLLRVDASNDETLWREGTITGDIRYEKHTVVQHGTRRRQEVRCGGSFEVTLDGTNEKCRVRHGDKLQICVVDDRASSKPTYMHGEVEHVFHDTHDSDNPSYGDLRIRCRPVQRVRKCGEEHSVHRNRTDTIFEAAKGFRGLRVKVQTHELRNVVQFRGTTRNDVELKVCGAPLTLTGTHALKAGTIVDVKLKVEDKWRRGVKVSADASPKNGHFAILGADGSPIQVPRKSEVVLSREPNRPQYTVKKKMLKLRLERIPLNRISSVRGPVVLDFVHKSCWSTSHNDASLRREFSKAQQQLKGILETIQRSTTDFNMPGSWGDLFKYVKELVEHVDNKSTRRVTQVCRLCAEAILYCWAATYNVSDDLRERILTTDMALKGRLLPFLYRQGIGISRNAAVKLAFVFYRGTAGFHLLANHKQGERLWNLHDTTLLVQTLTNELGRLIETLVRVKEEREKGLVRNRTRVVVDVVDDGVVKKLTGTFVRTTLICNADKIEYGKMEEVEDDDDDCTSSSTKDSPSWTYEVVLDRDVDTVDILRADSDKAKSLGDTSVSDVRRATVVREETHKIKIQYEDTKDTAEVICTPGYLLRLKGVGAEDCYFDPDGRRVHLRAVSGKQGTQLVDERSVRNATVKSSTVSSPLSVKYCDNDETWEIPNAWKIEMPVKQVLTVVDKVEVVDIVKITKTRPL